MRLEVAPLASAAVPKRLRRAVGVPLPCWQPGVRCGVRGLGCAERTDGIFVWPEGLVHYVESHDVRLPEEFTQHVLAHESPKKAEVSFETPRDIDWWLAQCGFCDGTSFRSPPPVGNFVARLRGATPSANVLAALRAFPSAQQLSVSELRDRILQGTNLVLLEYEDESPRPPVLAGLEQLGISIEFHPLHSKSAG